MSPKSKADQIKQKVDQITAKINSPNSDDNKFLVEEITYDYDQLAAKVETLEQRAFKLSRNFTIFIGILVAVWLIMVFGIIIW